MKLPDVYKATAIEIATFALGLGSKIDKYIVKQKRFNNHTGSVVEHLDAAKDILKTTNVDTNTNSTIDTYTACYSILKKIDLLYLTVTYSSQTKICINLLLTIHGHEDIINNKKYDKSDWGVLVEADINPTLKTIDAATILESSMIHIKKSPYQVRYELIV